MRPFIRAVKSDKMGVRILRRLPLDGLQGPIDDQPVRISAASTLIADERHLWIFSDDRLVLHKLDWNTLSVSLFPLQPDGGSVPLSKAIKPDWEAATWVSPKPPERRLLFMGSGSRPQRMEIGLLSITEEGMLSLRRFPVPHLYDKLAHALAPEGELNIEGVVWKPDTDELLLFQRGTAHYPNAIGTISWPTVEYCLTDPERSASILFESVQFYDLGQVRGVPLAFTDATWHPQKGLFYVAAAEDTSDAYEDGLILGSVIGWFAPDGKPYFASLSDERGNPVPIKVEGIAPDPAHLNRFFLITDPDEPCCPSELLWVHIEGLERYS
ncbi:MAG: hypothetical protein N3E49_04060 [Bacteroidia bacterium]|nr:hypothetical protein [Bacteroidia bacterium]